MLGYWHTLAIFPTSTMPSQSSFLALAHNKTLRCERFLLEMDHIVPWKALIRKIEPYYEEKKTGRKRKELKLMLKIYFLQQWYNLSDPGAEEAIYDRNSFQKFLDMDLLSEIVPDETTICKFRHLLEEHKLQKKFLKIVNDFLERHGLFMKKGSIVDATMIAASSSTKNKDKKRDPDMSSTKKGNQWYFGMKAHIGVDADTGMVHSVEGTTAKVHDRNKLPDLLHGEEKAIFGDQGYACDKDKKECRDSGDVYWYVSDKAKPKHKLSSKQRKRNRKLSSVRAKVEHPFKVVKDQWKHRKVKYKGLEKNTLQLNTLFALSNIYLARKTLLPILA